MKPILSVLSLAAVMFKFNFHLYCSFPKWPWSMAFCFIFPISGNLDDHINLPHRVIWELIKNEIRFNQSLLMWEMLNLVMHDWNVIWFPRIISIFGASCDLEDTVAKMWVPTHSCAVPVSSALIWYTLCPSWWPGLSRQTWTWIAEGMGLFTLWDFVLCVSSSPSPSSSSFLWNSVSHWT